MRQDTRNTTKVPGHNYLKDISEQETAVSPSFAVGKQRQKEVPTSYQDSGYLHVATASISISTVSTKVPPSVSSDSPSKLGEFLPSNTDETGVEAELHGDATAHQLQDLNVFQICIQETQDT